MNRKKPVLNKICSKKETDRFLHQHTDRVSLMKSTMENFRPKTLDLKFEDFRNLKRETFQDFRNKEIEQENQTLLDKIFRIMQKPNNNIINQNYEMYKKSLNIESRKKEQHQITIQNEKIYERIKSNKSTYNVQKWINERNANVNYMKNICEFKPTLLKISKKDDSKIKNNNKGKIQFFYSNHKIGYTLFFIDIHVLNGYISINLSVFSINLILPERKGSQILEIPANEGLVHLKYQFCNNIMLLIKNIQFSDTSCMIFKTKDHDYYFQYQLELAKSAKNLKINKNSDYFSDSQKKLFDRTQSQRNSHNSKANSVTDLKRKFQKIDENQTLEVKDMQEDYKYEEDESEEVMPNQENDMREEDFQNYQKIGTEQSKTDNYDEGDFDSMSQQQKQSNMSHSKQQQQEIIEYQDDF